MFFQCDEEAIQWTYIRTSTTLINAQNYLVVYSIYGQCVCVRVCDFKSDDVTNMAVLGQRVIAVILITWIIMASCNNKSTAEIN